MDRTTTSDSGTLSVSQEILWECRAMVLHAMSSGLTVPGGLVQGLEAIFGDDEADARTSAAGPRQKRRRSSLPRRRTAG